METKYIKTNYGNYPLKSFKPVLVSVESGERAGRISHWKCEGAETYEWTPWIFNKELSLLTEAVKDKATILAINGELDFDDPHEIYLPDKNAANNYDSKGAEKRIEELRNKKPDSLVDWAGKVLVNTLGVEIRILDTTDNDFQVIENAYQELKQEGHISSSNYSRAKNVLSNVLFLNEEELKEYFTLSFIQIIDANTVDKINLVSKKVGRLYNLAILNKRVFDHPINVL